VTGVINASGYGVEKIVFQSSPKLYVTTGTLIDADDR
jgi:hypothetical protein